MKKLFASGVRTLVAVLLICTLNRTSVAYSVLTHEQIVDLL